MYQEFKLSKRNKLLGHSAQGWSAPAHVVNVRSLLIRISPHLCFIPHLKRGLCKAECDVGTCPCELYTNSVPWGLPVIEMWILHKAQLHWWHLSPCTCVHGLVKGCKPPVSLETLIIEKMICFCKRFSFWGKWEDFLREMLGGGWTYFCWYVHTALLETARWVCGECWSLKSVLLFQSCLTAHCPGAEDPGFFRFSFWELEDLRPRVWRMSCACSTLAGGLDICPSTRLTAGSCRKCTAAVLQQAGFSSQAARTAWSVEGILSILHLREGCCNKPSVCVLPQAGWQSFSCLASCNAPKRSPEILSSQKLHFPLENKEVMCFVFSQGILKIISSRNWILT